MGRLTLLKASLLSPPSSRKLTPLAALPATEYWPEPLEPWMFLLPVRSPPFRVMVEVAKPEITSRLAGLRPFSGRSTILSPSTSCEMEFSLVSTWEALAVTSTLSLVDPISSVTDCVRLFPASSPMPFCT